jgi:cell division cycle 2-like
VVSAFYDSKKELYELHLPFMYLPLSVLLAHPRFSAHSLPEGLRVKSSDAFFGISPSIIHGTLTKSIVFQILRAIGFLHAQVPPIAHRDINPTNFLFTHHGVLQLVDFGIAWDPSLSETSFRIVGEDSSEEPEWEESPEDMCSQVATG